VKDEMLRLLHHPLDPSSRLARLMLAEYGVPVALEEVKPWMRDPGFLELNPAGTVPILVDDTGPAAIGPLAVLLNIEERFSPQQIAGLVPARASERAEMWRLFEWVTSKLNDEVTRYVLEEKIVKRGGAGGTPDPSVLRVAKANLAEHMHYFTWLCATRAWLAGDAMTLADFALAAHLSSLDYLGDIDWDAAGETRDWYSRLKSRPAFRTLLNDRVVGMPPHRGYADLDF
jgi:glutathione S-transferase